MNACPIQARDGASVEELRDLAETALAALPAGAQNQAHYLKQNATLDLFPESEKPVEIIPARKLVSQGGGALRRSHQIIFQTSPVEALRLGFEGIEGRFHAGSTRRSGGREPWYPRGTEMRNESQLSIVAGDELAIVAGRGFPR